MTIDMKAIRAAAEADIGCPREELEVAISEIQSATVIALLDRLEAAEKDAARYQWLKANHQVWSWQPSRYNSEITSGFAHNNTGYSGFAFEGALVLAMKEQK